MINEDNSNNQENDERIFHKIIKEICADRGIKVEKLSYNWILQLTDKSGKVRHIVGNRFDINKEAAGNIACDKYATYEVLKSQNVPVIEHKMVFNPVNRKSFIDDSGIWSGIIKYFHDNNEKLVVKPNNGCEGIGVYLCQNVRDLEIAISKLFKTNPSISICPYYAINTEYRTFYIDGDCELIYGKHKPFVIGDGIHTLAELIVSQKELPDNSVVNNNLQSIDLSIIPSKEEKVYISWKHNLSGGAVPEILEDCELKNQIIDLAKKTAKAMNIDYATIDIINTEDGNLFVLEVNSGVCMSKFIDSVENGYDIAKKIYSKSIDKIFK